MIRPAGFGYNEQTAVNNYFQTKPAAGNEKVQQLALDEFDNMVSALRENDIDVLVVDDTHEPVKPDAIFPNNWISSFPNGIVAIYPMYAANRRIEKRDDILEMLREKFEVSDIQD